MPRQGEGEGRAAAFAVAGGGEVTVVGSGEGAGDGQSDAAAACGAAAGRVGAVEAVEHLRQVLGGDAVAGVGDGDGAAGRGVAQGVGEQVVEDFADPVGVGGGVGRCRAGPVLEVDCLVGEGGRCGADRVGVVDEAAHSGGLLAHGVPGVGGGGDDAVFDAFQEAVEGGERGA